MSPSMPPRQDNAGTQTIATHGREAIATGRAAAKRSTKCSATPDVTHSRKRAKSPATDAQAGRPHSMSRKTASQIESEESVLQLLRDNDPQAAERLIEIFGDRVYGLSLRILSNEQDAQEAVQETFLTIWRKWDTFKGNSKFSSWIYRIAANQAFMKLRKRKKHNVEISLDQVDENGTPTAELIGSDAVVSGFMPREITPLSAAENKELSGIIERAVESLSPTYRTAYMLKDIDGLSLKEISDIMGLSEAAVKSRVHRARLELRRKITPYLT